MLATASVASATDCYQISKEAAKQITAAPADVLSIVVNKIQANESCVCEVVKTAIVTTEADKQLVAQIVDAAITAAPKKVSLVSTCALAVAPDAQAEIVKVTSKYSKVAGEGYSSKGGDYSSKGYSSKGGAAPAQAASTPESYDPLNFIALDGGGSFAPSYPTMTLGFPVQTVPGNPYATSVPQ